MGDESNLATLGLWARGHPATCIPKGQNEAKSLWVRSECGCHCGRHLPVGQPQAAPNGGGWDGELAGWSVKEGRSGAKGGGRGLCVVAWCARWSPRSARCKARRKGVFGKRDGASPVNEWRWWFTLGKGAFPFPAVAAFALGTRRARRASERARERSGKKVRVSDVGWRHTHTNVCGHHTRLFSSG
jgi:hypothetical protein